MAISSENLRLLRYIQERENTHLKDIAKRFNKNQGTIRREILKLNNYYQRPLIEIHNSICSTKINYQELATLIHSLPLEDYISTREERIHVFLVMAYFQPSVNTTTLYESWGLSMTTKKNDIAFLKKDLKKYNLSIVQIPQKGLSIVGNRLKYRILISNILYPLYDIDQKKGISERVSNTPIESLCFQYIKNIEPYLEDAYTTLSEFLENYLLRITSLTEKFGILFICLTLKEPAFNPQDMTDLPLPLTNFYFTSNRGLNEIYNRVLTLLDYSQQLYFPHDSNLYNIVKTFVNEVLGYIPDTIYTIDNLFDEVYHYFYKQILMQHLHVNMPDRLIRHLDDDLQFLYNTIEKYIPPLLQTYHIVFTKEEITTLTFILQKMILSNKIINTPRTNPKKRVVIITHASYERIGYFIYQMKAYFEVEVVEILNLTQRETLKDLTFDFIISLSERIHDILKQEGYPVILLHFYLGSKDVDILQNFGFNRIRTKFLADKFVEEIEKQDVNTLALYLKEHYSDYFI